MPNPDPLIRIVVAILLCFVCAGDAAACAMMTFVRDGEVLFGNNEDYIRPGVIWFVPGGKNRLGRVNVGFDDDFAQGSLNEKGLCFDSAALPTVPWTPDPGKETPKNLIELIMNQCATVDEALGYFEQYNCKHLAEAQFMFADASGASAVIAWLPDQGLSVTRRDSDAQVLTNTRLEASGYRCQRFVRASQVLGAPDATGRAAVADALAAIHQRGPGAFTSYSTIYDLKRLKVYVYNLANFDEVVEFDLLGELNRRRHTFVMADLFKNSPPIERLQAAPQRVAWDTRVTLDDTTLTRYEGRYSPSEDIEITIERDDAGGLRVLNPGQPPATLFPETETVFRIAPDRGQVSFQMDDTGQVEGLTLHKQIDIFAKRVSDL